MSRLLRPLDERDLAIFNKLTDSGRGTLLQLAMDIAEGFEGQLEIIVLQGGGIRSVRWVKSRSGDSIKEILA